MGKREGNSISSLSELDQAFKGEVLPEVARRDGVEMAPSIPSNIEIGDNILYKGTDYEYMGNDANGLARLYCERYEGGEFVKNEILVSREELLEGFRHAQEISDTEEKSVVANAEHDASTRIVKDVVSGTPEPVAVDTEIQRDVAAVESVIAEADAVPTPAADEVAPEFSVVEAATGLPEGEVSVLDRGERAKQLAKEAARALELEGELAALRRKKGKRREVGDLYAERDRLDSHIHALLREIAPEVLGSIDAGDISNIEYMRELLGGAKNMKERREKEEQLKYEGEFSAEEYAAYKAALNRRNMFIRSLTALGIPHHVATRLYRTESEAVRDFGNITLRAESGDVKALESEEAKRLFSRFGIDEEGVEHFIKGLENKKPEESVQEFENFVTRGNGTPVLPSTEGVVAAAGIDYSEVEPEPPVDREDVIREIQRLENRLKHSGFPTITELRAAKARLAELKAQVNGTGGEPVTVQPEVISHEKSRQIGDELIGLLGLRIPSLEEGSTRTHYEQEFARLSKLHAHANRDQREAVNKALDTLLSAVMVAIPKAAWNEIKRTQDKNSALTKDFIADWRTKQGLDAEAPAVEAEILPPEIKPEDVPRAEAPVIDVEVIEENNRIDKREGKKENAVISKKVIEKFGNEGVSFEELTTIPGFTDLSEGQQLLMLKNYSTALVGKVKREAKKEADAAWSKRTLLGKLGLSLITMGLAKNVSEQTRQRDIARKLSSGDHLVASERRAMLEAFAKVAAEGPEVEEEGDGSLRMNYVSIERFKGDPEAQAIIATYNDAASKFAKIPKQWLDADFALTKEEQPGYFAKLLGHKNIALSGKEHLRVAETKEAYQEARTQLLAALERYEGTAGDPESRRSVMLELNGLDERVQLNQLFASNPDAEEALQNIRDTNVFTRSVSEFVKNRGQYMAYGATTRIAAAAALGAIALPATAAIAGGAVAVGVAGAVGYFQARREAKELLKTRRASGQIGEVELQEDVVYTANNEDILARKEEERDAAFARKDQKVAVEIEGEIRALREKIKSGHILENRTRKLREFRDAKFYTDRVERLLTKLDIANEMGNKESAEMLERKIAQTATLMRELMKQGMLSFGQESRMKRIDARAEGKHLVSRADDARSAINSLEFMQALGHADAVHSLDMSAIEAKLGSVLEGYRENIDASARKRSNKHIAKAVALRVGFGLAGYGLMHAASNFFGHSETGEALMQGRSGGGHHVEAVAGVHTVSQGETLTAIVRKFPEIAKLPHAGQETAIANLVKHLSPEQLRQMGISSGNADLIRIGEHIDITKLHKHVEGLHLGHANAAEHVPAGHAHPFTIPRTPIHDGVPVPRQSILPKFEHVTESHVPGTVAEMHAAAQNKMAKSLAGIFGKKGIFGSDHTREWEGDSIRNIHGLKDASAESLLSKRQSLFAESRVRADLREYMRTLSQRTHVHPKTGETAEMFIRRALFTEEQLAHGVAKAGKSIAKAVVHEQVAGRVTSGTSARVMEATTTLPKVHSTNEALGQLMPAMMKKFPELAHQDEGVRINVLTNFLRGAKPEHFKALGLDAEDMQKFVGGGKVDAARIAEYFHHSGAHEAVNGVPAAHVAEVAQGGAAKLEQSWDTLSMSARENAAEQLVPEYVKHELYARFPSVDTEKFLVFMKQLPAQYLGMSKQELMQQMPEANANIIHSMHELMISGKFAGVDTNYGAGQSVYDYIAGVYKEKMLTSGIAAVK